MLFSPKNEPTYANEHEEDDSETITQRVIGWLWFLFKLGFVVGIIAFIVIAGAVIGVVKGFSEKIPIISDSSYRPNLTSQVFDINGKLLAKLHGEENRTRILSSKEIPNIMKYAVVAIEDERFYSHYGIDIVGIARAMLSNLKAGRIVQGASTLTQQLVKNAFLTSEKTFQRKAIEAMMAFQIERKYSKDEILTLYLNEIYFGHGAYGLAAAAEIYYGKDPKDLTISECAALAGIPKSPVAFSPIRNPKRNAERRNIVLSKMVELGLISPADYETAKKNPPVFKKIEKQETKAPYFVAYVRDQLLDRFGSNLLYNGGLKIYTTIDLDMQQYAEEAMASAPIFIDYPADKFPDMNGSLICLDPKNGHIKAMYGGRSFEKSQFNRVTQAYRQAGSAFKPFVYATALEEGMLPTDTILDGFISYTNPWTKAVWAPKNYDRKFHGRVTLLKAICRSFNIPPVRLIDKLTPAKVIRFTKKLGITSMMEPNLSLALGSGQFTPLEIASAYGVFANLGVYCKPMSILKVEDRDGNIILENTPKAHAVMKEVNAAMVCDMLRTVVERGTGAKARIPSRSIGGKTGTTNNYVDAWFCGITPDLVSVVQFGFDMPKTLGNGKSGGGVCCPPWKAFMEKALKKCPPRDFPCPNGAVRCKVCMISGKLASRACPRNEVVYQTFPIESQPLIECSHAKAVSEASLESLGSSDNDEGGAEADASFMPDAGFFHSDYQTNEINVKSRAPATENKWFLKNNSSSDAAKRWGVDKPIPPEAFIDEEPTGAAIPKPTQPRVIREPGVVLTPPKVDFRDDYR